MENNLETQTNLNPKPQKTPKTKELKSKTLKETEILKDSTNLNQKVEIENEAEPQMKSLVELDLNKSDLILNNNLCALRCYHCNKSLSEYHVPILRCEDLKKFFEEKIISRYCCKMILLQNYIEVSR